MYDRHLEINNQIGILSFSLNHVTAAKNDNIETNLANLTKIPEQQYILFSFPQLSSLFQSHHMSLTYMGRVRVDRQSQSLLHIIVVLHN